MEYKTEAYDMFTELMTNIKNEIVQNLFRSTANLEAFGQFLQNLPQFLISSDETGAQQTQSSGAERPPGLRQNPLTTSTRTLEPGISEEDRHEGNGASGVPIGEAAGGQTQSHHEALKVGRNDPCPCGSGKKFKNCCGRTA